MRPRSRYLISAGLLLSLYLIYLFTLRVDNDYTAVAPIEPESNSTNRLQPTRPKITMIAIWVPRTSGSPIYLPYFFQSVEANPQVDLLFVQVDKFGVGCKRYSHARNIQELCLTEELYHNLHVNFLCKEWGCTSDMKQQVLEKIKADAVWDTNNSFFRVLRNGIFKPWIDPATTIWGWCDVDAVWGNFKRVFPWDVANDFDVFVAAAQPDFANEKLLFTRGHMAFFRNSPDILRRFLSYHKFESYANFVHDSRIPVDAEESAFSHFIFSEETSFTFLTFEAMVNNYDTVIMSSNGVYYSTRSEEQINVEARKSLISLVQSKNPARLPTFAEDDVELEAKVFTDGKTYSGGLWFDLKYATYVVTGWTEPFEREQRQFIMRREPHGPITQRLQLREKYILREGDVQMDECLYKHWQIEKHEPWFKSMRLGGIKPKSEVLVQYRNKDAEIWSMQGDVVHRTSP